MKCIKCGAELPDDSIYCNLCGKKQTAEKRKNTKSRGNGQGSVYQLPNKKWRAVRTIAYFCGDDNKVHRATRSRSDFKTKKEALAYLSILSNETRREPQKITFWELYEKWLPTHRADKSTVNCYKAAFKHFRPVWHMSISDITVDDLQECVDACGKGKRTRQNMKAVCGLIYKYGIPRGCIPENLNLAQFLVVGEGNTSHRPAFTLEELEILWASVGAVPYVNYILCQIYTGFRPSEFLAIDAINYDRKKRAIIGGAKTEAGKDRIVTISPKIQPIIDQLVKNKVSGPVFCAENGKPLSIKAYRELFYAALERCGIDNPTLEDAGTKRKKYTPHCCRHTFATLMKNVNAAGKDKLELIGHTSEEMLRYYQDVSIDDLRKITDAI